MDRGAWEPLTDELVRRRAKSQAMGGTERTAREHEAGRLNARQRLRALCDQGSFIELWGLAGLEEPGGGIAADGFPCGHGLIAGRPAAVGAEDFTSKGGSIGTPGGTKRERLARLAGDERMPLVVVLHGAGARAAKALDRYIPHPHDLGAIADLAGVVPTVAVVAGPSAGHGALTAALSDLVVMVRGRGALFTAGPQLVQNSIGETTDPESLGGADVHAVRSGIAHVAVDTEEEALAAARRYLSYLPSSSWEQPPLAGAEGGADVGLRPTPRILELLPPDARKAYDIRPVLDELVDAGSRFELQPDHGPSIITAFARIGGHAVAIVANQPSARAGAVDAAAARKAARFIEVASSFHLPLVFLADNPGVMAGSASEEAGILRAAGRMFAAQHRCPTPKIHVTLRKAFGFGTSIMGLNQFDGRTFAFALPGVTLGVMPARGSADVAKVGPDARAALERSEAGGPWKLASEAAYDDVIHPAELRDTLVRTLHLADRPGREARPVARLGYLP
ncbi:MAG: putative biotin dependent carboxylase [Actinomycetia bacterium]|nr:putative biotin dependent carboxylase [Actinomycetes bacterium]